MQYSWIFHTNQDYRPRRLQCIMSKVTSLPNRQCPEQGHVFPSLGVSPGLLSLEISTIYVAIVFNNISMNILYKPGPFSLEITALHEKVTSLLNSQCSEQGHILILGISPGLLSLKISIYCIHICNIHVILPFYKPGLLLSSSEITVHHVKSN